MTSRRDLPALLNKPKTSHWHSPASRFSLVSFPRSIVKDDLRVEEVQVACPRWGPEFEYRRARPHSWGWQKRSWGTVVRLHPLSPSLAHLLPDAVLDGAPDLYLANILENDQTTNFLYFQVFFSRGLRLLASLPCTLVCWLTSPLQFTIMHHTWSLRGHRSLFCLRKYGKVRINKLSLSCKLLLSSFCIVFDNHF